jgi:prepilin-type N-terminal cleavage/methylation domain-containing protein
VTRLVSRRRQSEEGFTLVELIMAVAILGVISVSIGVVGVVMFRSLNQTQNRLNETRGPRFASVYWIPDVASTENVNPAGVVCGSGGTNLVTLRWVDDRAAFATTTVTYAITTTGTGLTQQRQLVRRLCVQGSSTATRTTVIAPNIATPGAEVTCGNGTTYSACIANDPDKSLLLTLTPKSGGGTFSLDAYREVT